MSTIGAKSLGRFLVTLAGSALALTTVSSAGAAAVPAVLAPPIASVIPEVSPTEPAGPAYPVNVNGQTFGSALEAKVPGQEPDLIAAIGVDGTEGYVLGTDLYVPQPKTPEEAVAYTKAAQKAGGRDIPLFSADGKQIGVFHVDAGSSSEK